jgi:hypothetical protein
MQTFKRNQLANQLDQLTNSVIKRGIYVVTRDNDDIKIVDYLLQITKLNNIPTVDIANQLCENLNCVRRKSPPNFTRAQSLIDHSNRLISEIACYRHTLSVSKDDFKKHVVSARLDAAAQTLKQVIFRINKTF